MNGPLVILGKGLATGEDRPLLAASPEFRKSTPKMQLASISIGRAIESLAKTKSESAFINRSNIGFILNSGYGELEATTGFLQTFAESGVARPLLFQNSLHSSTTGFCAIHFKLEGPAFTLNHRVFGGEQALLLADTLIADGECDICLVTTVETVPKEFADLSASGIEGSASVIVARSDWASNQGFVSSEQITEVRCNEDDSRREDRSGFVFASLYGHDAVFGLVKNVEAGRDFKMEKPVGGNSEIRLT